MSYKYSDEWLSIVECREPGEPRELLWSRSAWSCRLASGTVSSKVVAPDVDVYWDFWSEEEGSPFVSGYTGNTAWVFDVLKKNRSQKSKEPGYTLVCNKGISAMQEMLKITGWLSVERGAGYKCRVDLARNDMRGLFQPFGMT